MNKRLLGFVVAVAKLLSLRPFPPRKSTRGDGQNHPA